MPSATPKFVIASLSIDSVTWTPVIPSVPCNGLVILCTSAAIKVRTDSGDANTEIALIQNYEQQIAPAAINARFQAGQIVAYLQAAAGSPSATLMFVF